MFLLFLVVCGVVALVVVKVVKPNAAAIQAATPDVIKNATNTALTATGLAHRHRLLLMEQPAAVAAAAAGTAGSWRAWQHWLQDCPQLALHHRLQHQPRTVDGAAADVAAQGSDEAGEQSKSACIGSVSALLAGCYTEESCSCCELCVSVSVCWAWSGMGDEGPQLPP